MNDEKTDKRLWLLVGLAVAAALVCIGWAVRRLEPLPSSMAIYAAVLVALIGVANGLAVQIRVRAQLRLINSTSTAVVVTVATVGIEWAILCTATGVLIARVLTQRDIRKICFNTAKDTLATTMAASIVLLAGVAPGTEPGHPRPALAALAGGLCLGFIGYALVDELLSSWVIATATRTSWRHILYKAWDSRIISRASSLLLGLGTVAVTGQDPRLLITMPAAVWALHLASANRLRRRAEREDWQRLAQTTDELNVIELDTVLRSAVVRAAEFFSADEAEVELHTPAARLVRGSTGGLSYDGLPGQAPDGASWTHTTALHGHDQRTDVGILRLRFRGPVRFNESEEYKLHTFASALCTAVRNASAYAQLQLIAATNAHAAAHDPLTGLANRRALLDRGTAVLGDHQTDGMTALLLIDLNHFKEVNDTLGHAAGDQVLCTVARRLQESSQPGDLVARLGGDEFAVLFEGLRSPAMASHRAERLLSALHEPVRVDGMRITVEGCGGIAVAVGTSAMAELLRRADVAMYQAKRASQRLVTYAHTRDTADVGRLALGGELPRAVAESEFEVEFQPIVDLASGEVVAAEALTRWRHPDHGNLTPVSFLDAVERSGVLAAFTDDVLDQSLSAVGQWRAAGFDLPVAVNVSPRSLLDADFPAAVLDRLAAHELPADRLFLELTETLTISQLEIVDQVLRELRTAGVQLALDDFGTGYSSLSVLSRIRVHELKIDRSFVTAMDSSPEAAAVIRSTLDLGRSLDLVVVAEGVETEPQRRALWQLGCDAGQGHLFARSMPVGQLVEALRRGVDGHPGSLVAPLQEAGSVVRLPTARRTAARNRTDRLPHLPA